MCNDIHCIATASFSNYCWLEEAALWLSAHNFLYLGISSVEAKEEGTKVSSPLLPEDPDVFPSQLDLTESLIPQHIWTDRSDFVPLPDAWVLHPISLRLSPDTLQTTLQMLLRSICKPAVSFHETKVFIVIKFLYDSSTKTGEQHLFWAYRLHHFVQLRIVWWPLAAAEGSKLWFLLPGGKWTIALKAVLVMKIDSLTERLRRGFSLFPVESISEIFVDSSRLPDQSVFTVAIISSIKATFSITWQKTHTQKHTVIYKYLRSMMNGY